jgi:hypothetical protein
MHFRTITKDGKTVKIATCERCGKDLNLPGFFCMAWKYCQDCRPIVERENARLRMRRMRARRREAARRNENN